MPVKQNPLARWKPPAEWYSELVDRARKHDPLVIVGVASKAEIDRMERVVEDLELKAEEKAKRKRDNDPLHITRSTLHVLWKRAHEARREILELQDGKAKAYRRAFTIIGVGAGAQSSKSAFGFGERSQTAVFAGYSCRAR